MTKAIDNERTKLTANALGRASTVCITVGFSTPSVVLLYGQPAPYSVIGLAIVGWMVSGIVLYLGAHRILGGLKP